MESKEKTIIVCMGIFKCGECSTTRKLELLKKLNTELFLFEFS
jgi:predicted metal-binding protein